MNDDTLKKIFGRMGAYYRNIKPGPDCPPDDMLLDYVYEDLSEAEKRDVLEHVKSCERCRFEVLKLEADREGWQDALNKDPDAAMARVLGSTGLRRDEMDNEGADASVRRDLSGTVASAQHRQEGFSSLDQTTIDRIVAAAAAEVLENVDLHMAYWTKSRGKHPQYGRDTGLAQADGLGGDILPIIAQAVSRAWEYCIAKRAHLSGGAFKPELASQVSSFLHERGAQTKLEEEEIDVLANAIAEEVVEAAIGKLDPLSDA